jgi:hypothetical protein
METEQQWIIPLPMTVKHRQLWSERRGDEQLMLFNGTRTELLQLADNILGAAEVQG